MTKPRELSKSTPKKQNYNSCRGVFAKRVLKNGSKTKGCGENTVVVHSLEFPVWPSAFGQHIAERGAWQHSSVFYSNEPGEFGTRRRP